jgi:hypothetical protein
MAMSTSTSLLDGTCKGVDLAYTVAISHALPDFVTMSRYNMYGQITMKVAEQMRKPEVADFFSKLIQRTSPKSYQQALGEVSVTTRFLENFCGDQVGCQCTHACQLNVVVAHAACARFFGTV